MNGPYIHFVWLYDDYVGKSAPILRMKAIGYCPYWQELFETEPAPAGFFMPLKF